MHNVQCTIQQNMHIDDEQQYINRFNQGNLCFKAIGKKVKVAGAGNPLSLTFLPSQMYVVLQSNPNPNPNPNPIPIQSNPNSIPIHTGN